MTQTAERIRVSEEVRSLVQDCIAEAQAAPESNDYTEFITKRDALLSYIGKLEADSAALKLITERGSFSLGEPA